MYGYLRDGYEDTNIFRPDFFELENMLRDMAYKGMWKPLFSFLANEIKNQTGIRDYLHGEKSIQVFLAAYLSLIDYYLIEMEREMNKGFADLYLEPFWEKDEDVLYGYLIELKYIKRSEKPAGKLMEKLRQDAKDQLEQYALDEKIKKKFRQKKDGKLIKIYQIWHGWELKETGEAS